MTLLPITRIYQFSWELIHLNPTIISHYLLLPEVYLTHLRRLDDNFIREVAKIEKKINYVSWERAIASKESGGLGAGLLRASNLSLIVKWWWWLRLNPTTLWNRVITGVHSLQLKPVKYLSKKVYHMGLE